MVFDNLVILSVGLITLRNQHFVCITFFYPSTLKHSYPFHLLTDIKQIVKIIVYNSYIFNVVFIDFSLMKIFK
jgi:hypothetical protein